MKRITILFLITGCAYPISTDPNPVPETDAGKMDLDTGSDVVYQAPEVMHVPDAMPVICHVAACRAWSDDRILGACDPCQDAGELCRLDNEYGTCRFH